jgi:hypothetical protein
MSNLPQPTAPEPNQSPPANEPTMNELTTQNPNLTEAPEVSLWHWLTEPHHTQWLLPATGAWILGLDWFLFSQETITLGLAVPATAILGFFGGAIGTYIFQTRYAGDRGPSAWIKSILAGIVVGIPVPLAGTFVGGWILFNSGLASIRDRMLRRK